MRTRFSTLAAATLLVAASFLGHGSTVGAEPASDQTSRSGARTGAVEPGDVVATVAGQAITRAELEAQVSRQLEQLEMQRHQALEGGLGALIERRLLEREAEKRGLDVDALVAAEVSSKVSVGDAEVDAFYAANQARIGQPKEQIADRLRDYLEQQAAQEQRAELIKRLRNSFPVAVHLAPWRVELGDAAGVPSRGAEDAPVTVTIFSDFQCPGCRSIEPLLDQARQAYGDKLQLKFRQFPLMSIHPQAFQAAEAALCAGDQGKFWDMHASLFADQRRLDRAALGERAKELGLAVADFETCLDSGAKKAIVERDLRLGGELGISSTPTLYVNGRPVNLTSADSLTAMIDDELARQGS